MIRDTVSRKNNDALTSDRWHVVHARWNGVERGQPRFERSIVSEHDDSDEAVVAARNIQGRLAGELVGREAERRDQIFVRRPGFKSLKVSKRLERKRR
jgi:hypothetical protein